MNSFGNIVYVELKIRVICTLTQNAFIPGTAKSVSHCLSRRLNIDQLIF